MKYIDAEKLKAKIRKHLIPTIHDRDYDEWEHGRDAGFIQDISIIESLQQEQTSISPNLEEAAEKMYPMTTTPPTPIEVAAYYNAAQQKLRDAFKAGAEWMARQGVNIHGRVLPGTHGNSYVESDWFDKGYGGLSWNDEVDLIIRKKQ